VPPSDRIEELQRQRALLLDHLAWLEREIAASGGRPAGTAPPRSVVAPPKVPVTTPAIAVGSDAADPDSMLRQFAAEPENPAKVRYGCIAAFVSGLLLISVALFGIYYLYYR
jgi:hypothetical protein